MVDGPLPTHYEAPESNVRNPLYTQQSNPTRVTFIDEDNLSSPGAMGEGGSVYPHVFTTYRITEHHTAGGMSRFLPYLVEDRKSTRLNSSHVAISYAVFC